MAGRTSEQDLEQDSDQGWDDGPDRGREKLPKAKVRRDWKAYLIWLVPVAAVVVAGWFIYVDVIRKGPTLHLYFADASGLQAGKSPVKYRGAEIGQVKDMRVTADGSQVEVTVSLRKSAGGLAREHSKFWIVRPEVGVAQISGLGTIVSGDFVTVEPGDGKMQVDFQGLARAPVVATPGALQIVLLAERAGSLKVRTPVFYRGLQVGQVSGCDLGPNAQTVRATVEIEKRYAPLVRMDSVFWNSGGIDVNIGLTGADISAQSAKTLIGGGIDFATPDVKQKEALPGTEFRLYEKAQDQWRAWSPAIKLSRDSGRAAASQPAVGLNGEGGL